jgi:hypothetical protein
LLDAVGAIPHQRHNPTISEFPNFCLTARANQQCATGTPALRVKSNLLSRIKLICPVQSPLQEYFCFSEMQIKAMICHPIPKEGRWPTSSTRGGDAMDADGAFDESA